MSVAPRRGGRRFNSRPGRPARTGQLLTQAAGFGMIEVAVVAAVIGLCILAALPGLTGYQDTSAMQTAARQFMSDLRAAQEQAEAVGSPIAVEFVTGTGTAVTGYSVENNNGAALWTVNFPATVHATSSWPGLAITFQSNGSVTGSGTTAAVCVDNTRGLTTTVNITAATGRAALTSGTGHC
jgi:type II secretory pathway pseudopilin PulG